MLLLALMFGALWAGSAFAAAPEAPSISVEAVTGTAARLHGVLDPGKEGEPGTFPSGTYQFFYRASASECEGGLQEPVIPVLTFGAGQESVFAEISGLQPNTKYTACVAAMNEAAETTVSAPVTFKTALPPETPTTEPATEVTAKSARLHGVLNPGAAGEAGSYFFYYQASATECQGEARERTSFESASGGKAEAVSAEATELLPKTTYTFCLVAVNGVEERAVGSAQTFETPAAAPTVENETLSSVTATEAVLSAQIDPDGLATSYHVAYGASTPDVSLPASSVPVGVQQRLTGLVPATEYHLRFIATNSLGTTEGQLFTLKTPASSVASTVALPDGRAYEMVSPPNDKDVFLPITTNLAEVGDRVSFYPFRAAADGDAVVYEGDAPSTGGNGLELPGGTGNAFMATRGPGGWTANDITPAPAGPKEILQSVNYAAFSNDLSVGVLMSNEGAKGKPVAAGASICDGLYERTSDDGAFHALFEATPVPTPEICGYGQFYAGASTNNAHQLFQTKTALTSEAEETSPPEEEVERCIDLKCNLYDSVGGRLISVNTLGGKPAPDATFGSQPRTAGSHGHGINSADLSNVISEDGSRIFWTDLNTEVTAENPEGVTRLFVRENDTQPPSPLNGNGECTVPADSCSVQIDKAEPNASGHSGGGQFWTATNNGSRVFFTDCSRLTEDSTAVTSSECQETVEGEEVLTGNDLYEYDVETGRLTDLTVDHNAGDPLGANVLGVIGASQDGSYVYFVAGGALAPGATPGTCKPAVGATQAERVEENEGKIPAGTGCNLYVLHRGEPLRFVAELSWRDNHLPGPDDVTATNYGDWFSNLGGRTAEVTPDGGHLVFESWHSITGYDNVVFANRSREGQAHVEAFVYAAEANRVSCASCNPSGASPEGPGEEGILPGSAVGNTVSTYMLRWISEDGTRVFFDSRQPLVPQDSNGRTDMYEWEQEGTPGCPAAAATRRDGGCTFLLTGGISTDASLFVDASANGDDVFFTTRGKLVPGDHDENVKLYDARVGGGFPETSLACTGTGCQGVPPGPPIFATPSSVTFSGAGNFTAEGGAKPKAKPLTRAQKLARALKACRGKKNQHKRAACETQARRRYGPVSGARKATNKRRAK